MEYCYKIQTKVKNLLKKHKLVTRDLAYAIKEPPNTTSNRLNGYLQFTEIHQKILDKLIKERVSTKKEISFSEL